MASEVASEVASEAYCARLVAEQDRDRYLTSLYAPEQLRPRLLALYAFNLEISRIPFLVTEPYLGDIRLQWWRDTLSALYQGQSTDHPVAQELYKTIQQAALPQAGLLNLINAQEFYLYSDAFPDITSLEAHFGESTSTLMQMAAMVLGHSSHTMSGLAGVALGLAQGLWRNPAKYYPQDMLETAGAEATKTRLIAQAHQRLGEARQLLPTTAPASLPAFLPACLTELYLAKAQKHQPTDISALRRQFTIWRAARRNRF